MGFNGIILWLLLLVNATHGVFIRRLPCDLEEEALVEPVFEPLSLSGSLVNDDAATILSLKLMGDFVSDSCEELNGASAALMVDARVLGASVADGKPWELNGTCPSLSPKTNPRYDHRTYAIYEASFPLDRSFRFSSLDTTIQLYLNDTPVACMRSHITPYIGSTASRALIGLPLAIMILSGIATGAFRIYRERRRSTFRYELEDNLRDPVESTMPGLGPCLHYVQFIFLMGCLALSYPGFYRAVVGSLSWSSLIFRNWPVTHQFTYPGVQDGLYSYNATYGLEEMVQYLGSTATSDLWTNSIVNLVLLVVGTVVSIQLLSVYHWMKQLYTSRDLSLQTVRATIVADFPTVLRRTGWSVVRLVLDYFLLPLVCFSLYQMNNAPWYPAYHTSLALVAVVILAGMLALVVFRLAKTDRQGVFFQHTFLSGPIGQDWGFYTLYGIPFVRGIAIGGLQLSGLAQVIILLACEIWILACGFWNWHSGFTWRPALLASARLLTLVMTFAFIPEIGARERTKGIIAYCILSLHLFVLAGGFLVDCVYEPLRYTLYKHGVLESAPKGFNRTVKAPVFGIAQLSHRPERRFSFAHLSALEPAEPSTPHMRQSSSRRPGSSGRPQSSDDSHSPTGTLRSQGLTSSPSTVKDVAPSALSMHFSPVSSSDSNEYSPNSIELSTLDNLSEITHPTEYYAQREADQFYRRQEQLRTPPRRDEDTDTEGINKSARKRIWPWHWQGRTKKKERGFEVFRPAVTPRSLPNSHTPPQADEVENETDSSSGTEGHI